MKVKDLIVILNKYNQDLPVFIACEGYGNLQRADPDSVFYYEVKEIFASEDRTPAICLVSDHSL